MATNQISIAEVLAEIDQPVQDGQAVYFSLTYARRDGSIGHMAKGSKSVKGIRKERWEAAVASTPVDSSEASKPWNHNLKKSGNLLLFNHDKQQHREIKLSLIIKFNGREVFHG